MKTLISFVVLIDVKNNLGKKSFDEALKYSKDNSLDLVQVSPMGQSPVVCKILDFGKYVFSKRKAYQAPKEN